MISHIISYMKLDMISDIKMHFPYFLCPAAANPRLAQCVDETKGDSEPDQWILTRNVTMIIKALLWTWTWRKMQRFYPFCALPQQSESGGIVQPQDRFRLDGVLPDVVTLLQLNLVSNRPQGVCAQWFAQGGTPVTERLRLVYPALPERAGVGSIPLNSDAQNMLSFLRW